MDEFLRRMLVKAIGDGYEICQIMLFCIMLSNYGVIWFLTFSLLPCSLRKKNGYFSPFYLSIMCPLSPDSFWKWFCIDYHILFMPHVINLIDLVSILFHLYDSELIQLKAVEHLLRHSSCHYPAALLRLRSQSGLMCATTEIVWALRWILFKSSESKSCSPAHFHLLWKTFSETPHSENSSQCR